ncbi:hypothetical protein PIB30_036516 [Stylosanthes scabra]|uniref:Uncharacterized protein n=1 Tax=Stylosanthes scabra TaxID=79078 RepID=A0ABU6RDI9_9FABA|nr:hypothetical protein [Stylosanthes scabra]
MIVLEVLVTAQTRRSKVVFEALDLGGILHPKVLSILIVPRRAARLVVILLGTALDWAVQPVMPHQRTIWYLDRGVHSHEDGVAANGYRDGRAMGGGQDSLRHDFSPVSTMTATTLRVFLQTTTAAAKFGGNGDFAGRGGLDARWCSYDGRHQRRQQRGEGARSDGGSMGARSDANLFVIKQCILGSEVSIGLSNGNSLAIQILFPTNAFVGFFVG